MPAPELAKAFTPSVVEVEWARGRMQDAQHLLALMVWLKSYQRLGYFPRLGDVPQVVVEYVREALELPADVGLVAGCRYHGSGYVFTGILGDPIKPDRLSHAFQRLAEWAGLPPIRLHDLRHGAATLALAAGVELKVVQDMMGHSSIVLTADTYTSVLPEVARKAAEAVAVHVLQAGRLVPGTNRPRRRARFRRRRAAEPIPACGRPAAHPGRQIARPRALQIE
jgi:hypothetical protein